jgi:hypothetical protein
MLSGYMRPFLDGLALEIWTNIGWMSFGTKSRKMSEMVSFEQAKLCLPSQLSKKNLERVVTICKLASAK